MFEESLLESAIALARIGHTKGKIIQEMRAQGLEPDAARRLADRAARIANRGTRVKGLSLLAIGTVLIASGVGILWSSAEAKEIQGSDYAGVMVLFGIFLATASSVILLDRN